MRDEVGVLRFSPMQCSRTEYESCVLPFSHVCENRDEATHEEGRAKCLLLRNSSKESLNQFLLLLLLLTLYLASLSLLPLPLFHRFPYVIPRCVLTYQVLLFFFAVHLCFSFSVALAANCSYLFHLLLPELLRSRSLLLFSSYASFLRYFCFSDTAQRRSTSNPALLVLVPIFSITFTSFFTTASLLCLLSARAAHSY
jgi:hypothetical protein